MTISKDIIKKIYDITLESAFAKSKEVFIFELWEMWDFLWKEKSEEIRNLFIKNDIKVKQINNNYDVNLFSKNMEFINKVMTFRYINKEIFNITSEILIFDDKVSFYNNEEFFVIKNQEFADNQKQLFMWIWEQWISPKLWFDYIPNHSYYNSLDLYVNGIQVIVWPAYTSKNFYKNFDEKKLTKYFKDILDKNKEKYKNTSYIISFIWGFDSNKMVDIWSFEENFVNDKSWPLWDVQVYKNWEVCHDLSSSSWSTLLILWAEERLRRQSIDLKSYLNWPSPKLPLEVINWKDFYKN